MQLLVSQEWHRPQEEKKVRNPTVLYTKVNKPDWFDKVCNPAGDSKGFQPPSVPMVLNVSSLTS